MTDIAAKPEAEAHPNLLVVEDDQPTLEIAEASEAVELVVAETEIPAATEAAPAIAIAEVPAIEPIPAPVPAPVVVPEPAPAPAVEAPVVVEAVAPAPAAALNLDAVPVADADHDEAPQAKAAKPSKLPMIVMSVAAVASVVAAAGTIASVRTVAHASAVLEEVEAHRAKMRRLDQLIDEVDALRQREQIALVRVEQIASSQPATSADVRSAIAGLQIAMAKHQPGGNAQILSTLRDGQAELAERISIIYRRVEKMDEKLASVSPSPKAKP